MGEKSLQIVRKSYVLRAGRVPASWSRLTGGGEPPRGSPMHSLAVPLDTRIPVEYVALLYGSHTRDKRAYSCGNVVGSKMWCAGRIGEGYEETRASVILHAR